MECKHAYRYKETINERIEPQLPVCASYDIIKCDYCGHEKMNDFIDELLIEPEEIKTNCKLCSKKLSKGYDSICEDCLNPKG